MSVIKVDYGSLSGGELVYVPQMTSATTPSGEVISSGNTTSGHDAYLSFDNNPSTSTNFNTTASITDTYVGYNFGKPVKIQMYYFKDSDRLDTGYLKGSNDGITWETLDTWTKSNDANTIKHIENNNSYQYYAFFMGSSQYGVAGVVFYTLQFIGI